MLRKYLRILAYFLSLLALLVGSLFLLAHMKFERLAETTTSDPASLTLSLPPDPEWIGEGQRIAAMRGCADCHGRDLGGRVFIDDPGMGYFAGSNLTKGAGGLPADYSSEDFVRAIRYGKGKDKKYLQFMPSIEYSHMSDEDLAKLIVYLQSLPTVDREFRKPEPGPVAKFMLLADQMPLLFSGRDIPNDIKPPVQLTADESPAYGEYLAAGCVGCHQTNFAGGPIKGVPPSWPKAANLTKSGPSSQWSFEEFKKTLKTGVTPDGRTLNPQFMPWTATAAFTDSELKALYNFLQSLPDVPLQ